MYMSVVTRESGTASFPELAGARIAISGLGQTQGVDLARAFAENQARLFVQTADATPELVELGALLAQSATDLKWLDSPLDGAMTPTRFAQNAAQAFGGLDAVFNLVSVTREELAGVADIDEIEDLVVAKLSPLREITEVAANRMALTWAEGTILNIVLAPAPQSAAEAAVLGMLRTALAAMTADLARRWAGEVVRINAIGPKATTLDAMSGACLTSEPDIAALALHLASRKGRQLTGHVFDAEGVARRGC
jgi:3-oxoacyl-[acyl-carrier protein] reductase